MGDTAISNSQLWEPKATPGANGRRARASNYDTPGGAGPFNAAPAHMAPKAPEGPKLNKRKREELLKRYRMRIDAAKSFRDTKGLDDKWKRMIALYEGKHFPQLLGGQDMIAVNLCFSTINVILPAISVNYPKITVNAVGAEEETQAIILEAVINYWWKHFKIKPEFKLAVKDFLIIGHGWIKTGYQYVQQQEPCTDADLLGEYEKMFQQQADYADEFGPDQAEQNLPSDEDVAASIPDMKEVVVEDRPFAVRVSPFDVYVDPEATHEGNMGWIAQKIVKPLSQVMGDAKYDRQARDKVEPDSHLMHREDDDMRSIDDDIKRVTIWEFYDLQTRTLSVFTENSEDFLVRPMYFPYLQGAPFEMLRNYEAPDTFYPMGELEAIEDLQLELDKTRSQMMNHRKRYAAKYVYDRNAFDAAGIAQLESPDENAMIPATTQRPLNEVVVPLMQSPLPPEFYNQSEIIENDIDRVTAVSEYQRGAMPEIRRTATEASIIQEASNARSADKLATVEDFIARVAGRLVGLAQQFMTEDQTVRVIGKNGFPLWIPFNRDDIQGEYHFEVEAGSTQPVNETVRRQQALNLLQAMAPFAEAGVIKIDALVKHTLKYGFGIKNPDQFVAPPAGPEDHAEADQARFNEQINYKDAPPDIQRQMEEKAGYEPSQVAGVSPVELLEQKSEADQAKESAKPGKDPAEAESAAAEKETDRQHQAAIEAQKQKFEMEKLGVEHAQQDAQAEQAAAAQMQAGAHGSAAPNAEPGQVPPELMALMQEGEAPPAPPV